MSTLSIYYNKKKQYIFIKHKKLNVQLFITNIHTLYPITIQYYELILEKVM